MTRQLLCLLPLVLALLSLRAQEAVPVRNADFSAVDAEGLPQYWRTGGTKMHQIAVVPGAGPTGKSALQVEIQAAGSGYGEAEQKIKIEPDTGYVASAFMRSSADHLAFLQIKLYRQRQELKRITSRKSVQQWQKIELAFHSGEADQVGIVCRYLQDKRSVGKTVWFADVALAKPPPPVAQAITAVATFEAIGVRVPCTGAPGPRDRMAIRYLKEGTGVWHDGLPLFFCPTDNEFRGSLVGLLPDTNYDIECWFPKEPGARQTVSCRTWSEDVPVGEVRTIPDRQDTPLTITDQGKPDGWIVYRFRPGVEAAVSVGDTPAHAISIEGAAYVMIKGLTIRGGNRDAVSIRNSHHIRVVGCDIANWGNPGTRKEELKSGLYVDERGKVINFQAGVRVAAGSTQVVVEHNYIHAANGTANSWAFGHPAGPQGVILDNTGGNNVVRHNDIVGSESHWWNDAIESISNGRVNGGPYQDTDIYGNLLAFSNDDGTELDGGQINVRYHHNWVCWALCGISHAPNVSGPSYCFRNLIVGLGEERMAAGSAFKMGGNQLSPGMNVILHNTIYGIGGGLRSVGFGSGKDRGAYVAYSRNNVFAGPGGGDITNVSRDPRNDFDYDLTSRSAAALAVSGEEHAITEKPVFRDPDKGDFRLAEGSPGLDQAFPLPGFNDMHQGKGADMGALEDRPGDAVCFPPRPGGMSALPCRAFLRHSTGKKTRQTIALRVPASLGSRWTATTDTPWLRCEPSTGTTGDQVQSVLVGPVPELQEQRLHRGAITFRTDRGYTRTVLVDTRVYPERDVTVVFEAEAGTIAGSLQKVADPTASNGFFLHAPEAEKQAEGVGHEQSQPGTLTIPFEVPADGTYYVMGLCYVRGPKEFAVRHDSFYVAIDDGDQRRWDLWNLPYDRWAWSQAQEQTKGQSCHSWSLKAGRHTLILYSREPLARIDRIAITNDPYGTPPRE